MHLDNLKDREVFGENHGFKVYMGTHYLVGYIRYGDSKSSYLREYTLTWDRNIGMIRKTAGKYPQESYSAVAHVIQS